MAPSVCRFMRQCGKAVVEWPATWSSLDRCPSAETNEDTDLFFPCGPGSQLFTRLPFRKYLPVLAQGCGPGCAGADLLAASAEEVLWAAAERVGTSGVWC